MPKNNVNKKETLTAYLFNAPLIIIIAVFVILPVAGTILIAFMRDVTFLPEKFIGFSNYERLFGDPGFWSSVVFTLSFVAVSVVLELFFGMIFALLLNENLPGKSVYRVLILIPWAIPIAISGRVWQLIYNYDYGLINFIAQKIGIISHPVSWLGSSLSAFIAVVISDVWKTTPFMTIILLAGLSTIPNELYKQAMIDGTNFVERFFKITLPLLKPVIVVALLFRTIDAIRIFDLIYVLTGGGPGGSTTSLSLYAYNSYVTGDFGYGSAVSIIIFIAASLLSVAYIKFGGFQKEITG